MAARRERYPGPRALPFGPAPWSADSGAFEGLLLAAAIAGGSRSSPPEPCLSGAEETEQRLDDPTLRPHRNLVDRDPSQQMLPFFPLGCHTLGVGLANIGTAGVDLERLTSFRVDQPRDPDVRKIALARVLDGDSHDVMALRQDLERMGDIGLEKIGDDKYDRLLVEHF